MKTVVFIPKACVETKDETGKVLSPASFSGCVHLKIPNFFERQKLKTLLLVAVAADGETDLETVKSGKSKVNIVKMMEQMSELVKESVGFYQKVEMKNLKTGADLNSFDDLSCDPDADGVIQEIAQELAGGLAVSKN